jgi:hypothetical protein
MTNESTKLLGRTGFLTLPIFRDVLLVAFIGVFGWKLVTTELQIDLAAFAFTDFLALILALFSVWLSVAFYFKATEASNQFYDNTYRFTKEMSEMLGRIEAGFGEKLRHLDEGYSGIRERFDRMPAYPPVTNADVKKEEDEIRQKEREQKALLEDLAKKAKLAEHEKKTLFANLEQMGEELDQARMELRLLQSSSHRSPEDMEVRRSLLRYIAARLKEGNADVFSKGSPPPGFLRQTFEEIMPTLHTEAIRDLKRFGLLDENNKLTRDAVMRLQIELKRI